MRRLIEICRDIRDKWDRETRKQETMRVSLVPVSDDNHVPAENSRDIPGHDCECQRDSVEALTERISGDCVPSVPSVPPVPAKNSNSDNRSERDRLADEYRDLFGRLDTPALGMSYEDARRRLFELSERIHKLDPGFDLLALQIEAGGMPVTAPLPPALDTRRACRACGSFDRWRSARYRGPWKCATCHPPARSEGIERTRDGSKGEVPTWDAETEWLIAWLDTVPIPCEPFQLRSGVTVSDPSVFLARLKADAARGPDRIGTERERLLDLWRVINVGAGNRPGCED